MLTRKGIFNILVGVFASLIGAAFQFILMYLLIRSYGSQLNGFVKNSIVIVSFLGTVEGGLGAVTVIFLIKSLLQKDGIKANETLNTAKHQYKISGYIGIVLLIIIAIGYSFYIYLFENGFSILSNNKTISYPLGKIILIVLVIGSKNLIASFWTACYENLMQADQNNHLRRLILMICDLVSYSVIFYLISHAVDPVFVFLIFLVYSVMKGSLIYLFIKLYYPGIRIIRQRDNIQLVKSSNIVIFKNVGEILLINGDIIITALLLGLRISSILSLYMTITVGVRSVMMILINSFREFFAAGTAKNGRVNGNDYIKFETYAFMIGGFLFVNQFILSPYFVTILYAPQIIEQIRNSNLTFNPGTPQEIAIFRSIFYQPTFYLLVSLSSVFIVLAEPANVLVYAKANYKQTAVPTFVIGCFNVVLCFFSALIWRFGFNNLSAALYNILVVTCGISFLRFLYLGFYNGIFLTYNSNFKGVFQNGMILLVPIIIAILINYLFLTKLYNPDQIYDSDLHSAGGGQKLLNLFFGLIFASLFIIFANSVFGAPNSVLGILLRLPFVYRIGTKRQDKIHIISHKKYKDDFLIEPEAPYQKMWEHEEALHKSAEKIDEKKTVKDIYKLTG